MNFELMVVDGNLELYHEDNLHGNDLSFTFNENGTIDVTKHGVTTRLDVMFVEALREVYNAFYVARID